MNNTKKVVNTTLLSQRMSERDGMIKEGIYMETIKSEGRSIDQIIKLGKDKIGLSEDDILSLEFAEVTKRHNKQIQAFIQLGGSILVAEQTGLLEEELLAPLRKVCSELEKEIATRLNIDDIEDLYEEVSVEE